MKTNGSVENAQTPASSAELAALAELGPEAQGEIDLTLLEANLRLSPDQRLAAAQEAATQLQRLRDAFASQRNA